MTSDTRLPMDDPTVIEVLMDLERKITQRDLDAIERSIRLRGLGPAWDLVTNRSLWFPVIDESWGFWLQGLSLRSVSAQQALELLADAGVLGTAWSKAARDRVWEERGWK